MKHMLGQAAFLTHTLPIIHTPAGQAVGPVLEERAAPGRIPNPHPDVNPYLLQGTLSELFMKHVLRQAASLTHTPTFAHTCHRARCRTCS